MLANVRSSSQEHVEFHPQKRGSREHEPIHRIFEPQQLVDGELLIAIANNSDRDYRIKNYDPLGFMAWANTKPFFDAIVTIEHEQTRADNVDDTPTPPRSDNNLGTNTRVNQGHKTRPNGLTSMLEQESSLK